MLTELVPISYILSDCECHVAGTSLQSGKPICNLSNGVCSCVSGYIGDDCNQCDTNYYNSNSSDASMPICEGMLSFPPISICVFHNFSMFLQIANVTLEAPKLHQMMQGQMLVIALQKLDSANVLKDIWVMIATNVILATMILQQLLSSFLLGTVLVIRHILNQYVVVKYFCLFLFYS